MMKTISTIRTLILATAGLLVAGLARADCHWEGPLFGGQLVCDRAGILPSPPTPPSNSMLTVRNECNRPLRAGVHYLLSNEGSGTWRDYWSYVGPGQSISLPTTNRYACVYAETTDTGAKLTWGTPSQNCNVWDGSTPHLGNNVDIGEAITNYTYRLTCQ